MLLIRCIFLQLIQPIHAINKIQFITSIKLIHVSALGCHSQGVILEQLELVVSSRLDNMSYQFIVDVDQIFPLTYLLHGAEFFLRS